MHKLFKVEVVARIIAVSIDRLKPVYAMVDDIEKNLVSAQQHEASAAMPISQRDIRKIVQIPVQQPEIQGNLADGWDFPIVIMQAGKGVLWGANYFQTLAWNQNF